MTEIVEFDSNDSEHVKEFVNFQFRVYASNPNWVPPLVDNEVKFLAGKTSFATYAKWKMFLAIRRGKIVARVAAFRNSLYERRFPNTGLLGYFEALPDSFDAVREMLDAAIEWLKTDRVMIPYQGSYWNAGNFGFLIDNFDSRPVLFMPYNPPYYLEYMTRYGFSPYEDVYAYRIDVQSTPVFNTTPPGEYKLKELEINDRTLRDMKMLFDDAFTPDEIDYYDISLEELREVAKDMKYLLVKKLCPAIYHNNELVGLALTMPDYYEVIQKFSGKLGIINALRLLWSKHRLKSARLFLIGVKSAHKRKGLGTLLVSKIIEELKRRGYKMLEYSYVLASNEASNALARKFRGIVYRRYKVFILEQKAKV